ncbi:hypothetical protein HDV04_002438 [Boothiomyces sp. JEL0838]|nr:hypothetical protein HDV04_002438 [Boothiomyces sp. JEL0838]
MENKKRRLNRIPKTPESLVPADNSFGENDPTAVASILLSLGNYIENPDIPSKLNSRLKLPSLNQLISGNQIKCANCQVNPVKYCYDCNPLLWKTCTSILAEKHPHIISQFTAASKYYSHALTFIKESKLPIITLYCPLTNLNILSLPIDLRDIYLKAFEKEFLHWTGEHHEKKLSDFSENYQNGIKRRNSETTVSESQPALSNFVNKSSTSAKDGTVSPTLSIQRVDSMDSNATVVGSNRKSSPKFTEDPDDPTPRPQSLKSEHDLYTPRWVRYHKQFIHGISSSSGTPFSPPTEFRTVWNGTLNSSGPGMSVYLMTEGKCDKCQKWEPLFKNKKRFTHFFPSAMAAEETLTKEYPGQTELPVVISENPLKIKVGRDSNSNLFVPAGICVSNSLLSDMKQHEEGQMSSVWFRHASKCHSVI